MNLTRDDVLELLALLDGLPFDELDLQTPAFRLVLRRDRADGWSQELDVLQPAHVGPVDAPPDGGAGADDATTVEGGGADVAPPEGAVAVCSPIVGTFYRAPRPGADPFVELGDDVDEKSVVGLVETMKLFNSVQANIAGTVVEIVAADATAVEQGDVLVYVRPPDAT